MSLAMPLLRVASRGSFADHALRRAAKRTVSCVDACETFGGAQPRTPRSLVVGFRQTIAHAVRLRIAFFPATMAYHMSAQQYDATFKPTRLNNWEVPAIREREPMPRPPGFRSVPIVDENGHLLPGMPKRLTSFSTGYETTAPKRWPVTPSAPFTGASTMGYKGIQTTYLPTSTVFTRNNPDSDEFNYK